MWLGIIKLLNKTFPNELIFSPVNLLLDLYMNTQYPSLLSSRAIGRNLEPVGPWNKIHRVSIARPAAKWPGNNDLYSNKLNYNSTNFNFTEWSFKLKNTHDTNKARLKRC